MFKRASFFIVVFLFCSLGASEIDSKLMKIPLKNREKIEHLFSYFVKYEGLGFVLFNETKPACMISLPLTHKKYLLPCKVENPLLFQKYLGECWRAWSCYQSLFDHPGFVICEEYERINGGTYLQLFFLNKKTLSSLLNRHVLDFQEILGDDFSPEKFLEDLEKRKKLRPLIQSDPKLIGLLLGFGPESSSAYKEMEYGKIFDPPLSRAGYRPKGCCITPVSFRGRPDSTEVEELINAYTKEIQEIEKIYGDKEFLRITLEKLCAS